MNFPSEWMNSHIGNFISRTLIKYIEYVSENGENAKSDDGFTDFQG